MTYKETLEKVTECGLNIEEPICSKVMKLVKKALQKQIPQKPLEVNEISNEVFYSLSFLCGNCHESNYYQPYRPKYCKHCGQALDWSDTE